MTPNRRGLKFENRGWAESGHVEAPWTGGFHRPWGWNSIDYGSYSVVTRDNQGQLRSPFQQTMGLWTRYPHPAAEPYMHLRGGGGMTMGCVGAALVMMHGVPRDHAASRVWPTPPMGSDGNECWSAPRPLVLRANTEMRCEPDLSQEYPMTADFWAQFRNHSNGRSWELQYATGLGSTRYAWQNGPSDFRSSGYTGPYTWARRGEFAVFTADEEAGAQLSPIPWQVPTWTGLPDPGARQAQMAPLADPATRPDLLAGDTLLLQNNFSGTAQIEECIELAPAGWTAATGTFNPRCGSDQFTSPVTGLVNHEEDRALTAERRPEAGQHDNRSPVGARATVRRASSAGLDPPPPGFEWFEHRKAGMGCYAAMAWVRDLHQEARNYRISQEQLAATAMAERAKYAFDTDDGACGLSSRSRPASGPCSGMRSSSGARIASAAWRRSSGRGTSRSSRTSASSAGAAVR